MKTSFFFLLALFFLNCGPNRSAEPVEEELSTEKVAEQTSDPVSLINPEGKTIQTRFLVPEDFQRVSSESGTFAGYLQNLPLKEHGAEVHYYDGRIKHRPNVYCAVVDMKIGKRDLEQCADAIMRLRGEFLFEQQQYDQIHFNFTNGFRADYKKWRAGQRISVKGNKVSWYNANRVSTSYKDFLSYMNMVFSYAGTLSLNKELKKVELTDLQIGDVFIQGGSPGHAIIVVDLAINAQTGEKRFLLAQSYMPAQETQILQNPNDKTLSPWYSSEFGTVLQTPEWTFNRDDLKRFAN